MPSGLLRAVTHLGAEESADSQDQSKYGNEGDVAGAADGLREGREAETGSKQIDQADQGGNTKEVHNSDSKILFHFSFFLRLWRSIVYDSFSAASVRLLTSLYTQGRKRMAVMPEKNFETSFAKATSRIQSDKYDSLDTSFVSFYRFNHPLQPTGLQHGRTVLFYIPSATYFASSTFRSSLAFNSSSILTISG